MGDNKSSQESSLILSDGSIYYGKSIGSTGSVAGEVVFNTGMVRYPEAFTDPSYRGQILVLTYPLIGNYGVPDHEMENGLLKSLESDRIHIAGLIISDYSFNHSHWHAAKSLSDWLKEEGIESDIIESSPGRGNLIARLKGNNSGPSLALLGHLFMAEPRLG